jgi:hypothetical protein
MLLVPDKQLYAVFGREGGADPALVIPDALGEIVREACVERPVAPAR